MNETKTELRVMAFLWAMLFAAMTVSNEILGGLQHVEWGTLTPQGKFETVLHIIVGLGLVGGAFISQAVGRLRQGKSIIPNGGTDTFVKKPDGTVMTIEKSKP